MMVNLFLTKFVHTSQTEVHHQIPFREVEPDAVACSAQEIIKRLDEYGTHYLTALRALCRKKKALVVDVYFFPEQTSFT
jgi:hypothetical protein